jgi:hypothetical protein
MYDRKTWVILALCGTLLAVNLYYGQQQAQEAARLRSIEEAKQKSLTPPPSDPAIVPATGLSVEAPPPPTEEETTVLENDEVIFTLTNIGGGIKEILSGFKDAFRIHPFRKLCISTFLIFPLLLKENSIPEIRAFSAFFA